MSAHRNAAPVIIKRKKIVGGGGHHGGAWKVAYADFVTAMMAFFLLMWLLNATTEQQRKGISDYFSPTVPISRISGGGDGAFGGDSVFSEDSLLQDGKGASLTHPSESKQARGTLGILEEGTGPITTQDAKAYETVVAELKGIGGESIVPDELLRHVVTRVTDEGLVIELFDLEDAYLFEPDKADPTSLLRELAALLVSITNLVSNEIGVSGHVRAMPITLLNRPVWSLSTARADSMRKLLEESGLKMGRTRRVTGHADRSPMTKNPMDLRNNRLEVILLRTDHPLN